ncbi:MAG TPA: hypothetical protein DHU96_30525 [Actinobacteria bacterium]|nr:hypothetical protein [Actinomycetota bacterium]
MPPVEAGYGGYPPRSKGRLPLVRDVFDPARMAPAHRQVFEQVRENAKLPFAGITTDGRLRTSLFGIADEGLDIGPVLRAADDLLDLLSADQRQAVMHPIGAQEWRLWTNAYPVWEPHGLLLEDVPQQCRDAVLALVTACLSVRGAREVRDCMRLNAVLGEVVQDYRETLTEWMYRFSLFGMPDSGQPWGWQLIGHHLDLHCFVLGRQMVLTPAFLGAEPRIADRGPYAGIRLFDAEMERGLTLVRSLDDLQQGAILCPSMLSRDLPPELRHRTEGRMRSVRGGDNLVLPYEGVCAADMSAGQRALLTAVIEAYIGRLPSAQAAFRAAQIERHYGETYFAWVGTVADNAPFYYKIHSPVVLIEFDCHAGVFLANDEPEQFHVHTVVRTPNGNDYGRDLLRQHHARDHANRRGR